MRLQIRYYKRFDTDLLALFEAGYPLNKYFKNALYAYAHGEEYHLYVRDCKPHDLNGPQFIHTIINVTDKESIELMRNIKHGYRNAFCKMLLREALVYQYLGAYFADDEAAAKYIKREKRRIAEYSTSTPGTVIAEASVKRKEMYDGIRKKYLVEHGNASGTEEKEFETKKEKAAKPKAVNKKPVKNTRKDDPFGEEKIVKIPEEKENTAKQPEPAKTQEITSEDIFGQENVVEPADEITAQQQLHDAFGAIMAQLGME